MKVLITGFDPFNQETINPAYEAIKRLPDSYNDVQLTKIEIPTSFNRAFSVIKPYLDQKYDAVIMVGQAGGRKEISLEKVAINYIDAKICDNDQKLFSHQLINANGKDAYFTTLPIIKLLDKLIEEKIPAKISYTAGTFVCNYLMYRVLEYLNNQKTIVGFVHVPYCTAQVIHNDLPAMDLEMITKALEIIIINLFQNS